MKITAKTIDGSEYCLENITRLNYTQTAGVACDSLSIRFKSDNVYEIVSVKVFEGDAVIFNGYCDNQKISEDSNGFEIYLYARSSASVLIDNEAGPFTYNKPTAKQLWFTFARPFGFTCDLPEIQSDEKYEVSKGVSCYGAINQFVSFVAGKQIYVTPENSIRMLEKSSDVKSINTYNVLSASAVINRSEPVSEICFKENSQEAGYKLHTRAQLQDSLRLNEKKQYVNLSSLPRWQREYAVLKRLKSSYEDYRILEITVSGYVEEDLYQRFSYSSQIGEYDDFLLTEKKYLCDETGEITKLTLKQETDIKEITYVD